MYLFAKQIDKNDDLCTILITSSEARDRKLLDVTYIL